MSAWFFGNETEKNIQSLFERKGQNSDDLLHYELISYSSSIFAAKANIRITLDESNEFSQKIDDLFTETHIDIEIKNGPLLIDTTGLQLGSSAWKVLQSDEITAFPEGGHLNALIKQLDKSVFVVDFDNVVHYNIPLEWINTDISVQGNYDPKTDLNSGNLVVSQINYSNENTNVSLDNINASFEFTHQDKQLNLNTIIPNVTFKHASFDETIAFKVNYTAKHSLQNNVLNSSNTTKLNILSIEENTVSKYPVEDANFEFQINQLNVKHLLSLMDKVNAITDLQQQRQWVLEDQSELPEGQDKILLLEDSISRKYKHLPVSIKKVLQSDFDNNHSTPVFKTSLDTHYRNDHSHAEGFLKLQDTLRDDWNEDSVTVGSFKTLFQSHTEFKTHVMLDEILYEFLVTRIPLNKRNFELSYKQNKLLMQ